MQIDGRVIMWLDREESADGELFAESPRTAFLPVMFARDRAAAEEMFLSAFDDDLEDDEEDDEADDDEDDLEEADGDDFD